MRDSDGGAVRATLRAVWRGLPEPVRRLGPARALKRLVRGSAVPAPADSARVLETLDELDAAMRELDAAAAISDDDLRRGFARVRMRIPTDLPADPDSEAYRERQLALYRFLHGRPYDVANEVTAFDPIDTADRPFPYSTGSTQTVGDQLIAIGFLIRSLNLPPASTILELGPGWGNTTIALARMGHHVTAIDIEPNFAALIDERARRKGLAIETIQGDFSAIDRLDRTFHTVLFFECFHHSAQHQALVASLARVVAPGGQVVFAGEPIDPDFPVPWGVRLDGESLWAIRRHGWLELGFREDYFRDLLERHGWNLTKDVCPALAPAHTGWGTVYIARRS